jgi:hypothetical protein
LGKAVRWENTVHQEKILHRERPFVERGLSSREAVRRERRLFVRPFVKGRGYSSRGGEWGPFVGRKAFIEEGGGRSSRDGGDCSLREGGDCR